MKVLLRVDASTEIGTGHVMRCLTLADALARRGADCTFLCAAHAGHLIDLVRTRGFEATQLPTGIGRHALHHPGDDPFQDARSTQAVAAQLRPDWLVVDHYAAGLDWERAARPTSTRLMVIDDLADRPHDCDLLLDQNFYLDLEHRYTGLVPPHCELVLGPANVLLRPEFVSRRAALQPRGPEVRRVLVFFGGSDPAAQTEEVLQAVRELGRGDIDFDIVVGGDVARLESLRHLARDLPNVHLHGRVPHLADLIAGADIGIGAGGSSMWERCYLGLPTLTVTFADNQVRTTQDVATRGAIAYLGRCGPSGALPYTAGLQDLIASPERRAALSAVSLELVQPGTGRLADVMTKGIGPAASARTA